MITESEELEVRLALAKMKEAGYEEYAYYKQLALLLKEVELLRQRIEEVEDNADT